MQCLGTVHAKLKQNYYVSWWYYFLFEWGSCYKWDDVHGLTQWCRQDNSNSEGKASPTDIIILHFFGSAARVQLNSFHSKGKTNLSLKCHRHSSSNRLAFKRCKLWNQNKYPFYLAVYVFNVSVFGQISPVIQLWYILQGNSWVFIAHTWLFCHPPLYWQ